MICAIAVPCCHQAGPHCCHSQSNYPVTSQQCKETLPQVSTKNHNDLEDALDHDEDASLAPAHCESGQSLLPGEGWNKARGSGSLSSLQPRQRFDRIFFSSIEVRASFSTI